MFGSDDISCSKCPWKCSKSFLELQAQIMYLLHHCRTFLNVILTHYFCSVFKGKITLTFHSGYYSYSLHTYITIYCAYKACMSLASYPSHMGARLVYEPHPP